MIFDLGVTLPAPIYVLPRTFGSRASNNIHLGLPALDDHYLVFCADPEAARRFLTPEVADALTQGAQLGGGKLFFRAGTDGRICIAINSDHSLLRVRDLNEGLPRMRERMENELQPVLLLADRLKAALRDR